MATKDEIPQALREDQIRLYTVLEIDLGIARDDEQLQIAGTYFKVIKATDPNTEISVKLNADRNDLLPLSRGSGFRMPFRRLWLTNVAQAGKKATIFIANGMDILGSLEKAITEGGGGDFVSSNLGPNTSELAAAVTPYGQLAIAAIAVQVKAANDKRATIYLRNKGPSVCKLGIGIVNPTLATGYELKVDEGIVWNSFIDRISAISDATGCTLHFMESELV